MVRTWGHSEMAVRSPKRTAATTKRILSKRLGEQFELSLSLKTRLALNKKPHINHIYWAKKSGEGRK